MTDLLPASHSASASIEERPIPTAATPEPVVRLQQLSCRRGSTRALQDVDLDVRPGELLAVLGPSGCGKTTLLRSLAGLETPSSGRIEIAGQVVNDPAIRVSSRERHVGFVFQDLALWPHWSARRHLEFVLPKHGEAAHHRAERIRETLDLFRLTGLEKRRPSELSGGECQRLALARSVVNRPKLWLLDEPLSSLDAHLRIELRAEIERIHHELSLTTVLVTHDQEEAFALADRVAVLRAGRLEQLGTPDEIYTSPASRFVAGFVGQWLELSADLDGTALETPLGRFTLERPVASVSCGIRPEALRLVAPDRSEISGEVLAVHPAGAHTRCTVRCGATELHLELAPSEAPAVGEKVGLSRSSLPIVFDEADRPVSLTARDEPLRG